MRQESLAKILLPLQPFYTAAADKGWWPKRWPNHVSETVVEEPAKATAG